MNWDSLDIVFWALNVGLWTSNLALWVWDKHRRRFLNNVTPAMWEAAERLGEWQEQGLVPFVSENLVERARHLWKLCDHTDKEDVQHCFRMIAGPHGFAMYKVMLARRKLWQVL